MHLLILKTKAMLIKPRGRCRVKTWVDSGSILNGVRNLLNSTPLPPEGQIETAEGAAGTIKNVIIANELVILRENANQEEDQEIEMIVEIEEGAGLRGEETDLQEEADHQPDDTAMTQENLVAENMTEMIDVIEITIEEIDLEIMTEEKEEDLDQVVNQGISIEVAVIETLEDNQGTDPIDTSILLLIDKVARDKMVGVMITKSSNLEDLEMTMSVMAAILTDTTNQKVPQVM